MGGSKERRELYVGPTGQRTAVDDAEALRILAEDVSPGAAKIVLVQDDHDNKITRKVTADDARVKMKGTYPIS